MKEAVIRIFDYVAFIDNTVFSEGLFGWVDTFHAREAAWDIMLKSAEKRTGRKADRTRANA